jgi:O-antigen ligase
MAGAISLAAVFALQYGVYRTLDRFAADPINDARITFARNTFKAAAAFMPFGSGLGSFVTVYGLFERPEDVLPGIYVNRAHNDVLEFGLETGLPGIALMLLFAAWLAAKSYAAWWKTSGSTASIDVLLSRAATIIAALLVAHSFVDYPLRTEAMMTVMAFACALLVKPPLALKQATIVQNRAQATRTVEGQTRSPSGVLPQPMPPQRQNEPWDREFDWPSEWRKPPS